MDFILREWRRSDAADVAKYANNEKIARNLRDVFPYPYTLKDAKEFIDDCLEEDDFLMFRAIEADGHAVGSIALCRDDGMYRPRAELGYWLAEDFWGKGIMTEAVRRICKEGFARWDDLLRIYAEPYARNAGSRRVLEKAGFTLEGILRRNVFIWGEVCDSCMYALLTEEMSPAGD